MPALIVTGSDSGLPELQGPVRERAPESFDRLLQDLDVDRRLDDEELVGTVAAEDGAGRELDAEQLGQGQDRLVARRMAVGVVEQAEVVDVEQGDRDRLPGRPSRLDGRGEGRHEAAVVRRIGQRIAPGRLDQLVGLAADPGLGGPEDEEQDERRHEPGGQRDHDHVLPHRAETRGDRLAVAPDADHGQDAVAVLERQVLAQERFRRQGRAERLGRRRAGERRRRRAGDRLGEVGAGSPRPPTAPRSSDAMTVPSGRRISIRVMPPGDSRSWSGRWMLAASDEVVAPGSRSLAVSFSLTSARTVAASPPTTASRIDWEYVVETSTA